MPPSRADARPARTAPSSIATVAVFCGAQMGNDPVYRQAARDLGHGLARAGIRLVYGGGHVGLMGTVADAVLDGGGQVTGVIPEFLTRREVAHDRVMDLVVTDSMHSRKQRMFQLSDAFVMMPGGLGTLDEIVEIITWRQLGLHDKPILLCNIQGGTGAGSAAPLCATIEAAIATGFAQASVRALFEVADGAQAVLDRLASLSKGAAGESARL